MNSLPTAQSLRAHEVSAVPVKTAKWMRALLELAIAAARNVSHLLGANLAAHDSPPTALRLSPPKSWPSACRARPQSKSAGVARISAPQARECAFGADQHGARWSSLLCPGLLSHLLNSSLLLDCRHFEWHCGHRCAAERTRFLVSLALRLGCGSLRAIRSAYF